MKKFILPVLAAAFCLISVSAFSQKDKDSKKAAEDTTAMLGLAGDNLDLYAVLDLFQKSKTIEEFEKSLNDSKTKINNLDLNLDKKIDFIKVTTKKSGESFQFILQVDVAKNETQDVAVILLDKDKDKKVSLQIVGDQELYGKDYVIEPKGNSSVTPNPAYKGDDPVTVTQTQTVVVQQQPIVQYVYSPAYVPYAPPYYYGYYPPWFTFATVMAVGIYRSNHWYGHGGYYGGHYGGGNTVIINNNNNFNNYNNNKMRSNTVNNNQRNGNYGNGSTNRVNNGSVSNRQSGNRGNNPSASTRPSNNAGRGNNPSVSDRQSPSASNRQSPSASNRQSPSASNRQTASPSTRQTSSSSYGGGGSHSGGGRSMSGGGGRSFGGGGGGRRR